MESYFRPKYFVWFCAVFLVIFAALKYVSYQVLKETAERYGAYVFNWTWPGDSWSSRTQIVSADILSKDEHDAVVRVKGRQEMNVAQNQAAKADQIADCSATLKLYRRGTEKGDIWELGEVQFP